MRRAALFYIIDPEQQAAQPGGTIQVYASHRCPCIMHHKGKEKFLIGLKKFLLTPCTYFCVTTGQMEGNKVAKGGASESLLTTYSDFFLSPNRNLEFGKLWTFFCSKNGKDSTLLHLSNLNLTKVSQRG